MTATAPGLAHQGLWAKLDYPRTDQTAHDPEYKGLVERRNGFFETSFMPGRNFASPADFDAQFTDWLRIANARVVRTIKVRPVDRLDADRAATLPLPSVAPVLGWTNRVRLGRDYYVRVDASDYSVDPPRRGREGAARAVPATAARTRPP